MLKTAVRLSCIAAVAAAGGVVAQEKFHAIPDPGKLAWSDTGPPFPDTQVTVIEGDPSKPGPFIIRFRCPDNYRIAPHTHPATEAVTVLQGTFVAGVGNTFDASALTAIQPGGYFLMPGGTAHYGVCKGTTILEVHATGPWGTKMLGAD
jgi:quercetin dioxygenase-like cupin family protein